MNILEFRALLPRFQTRYPVEVVPIATALGIPVYKVHGWSNDVSGRIYRTDNHGSESGFAIDVNASHSENRRRFTIAHEISHYVLHREQIGHEMFDDHLYRSGLPDRLEYQANALAADILTPKEQLSIARARIGSDIKALANAFQVSEKAMEIRLGVPAW